MVTTLSKQAYIVQRKYPFLQNFPFGEYRVEIGDIYPTGPVVEDREKESDPRLVKFVYEIGSSQMTIVIFEQELNWINSISNKVTNLDQAAKTIDAAIAAEWILDKRDGVNFAEHWCEQLNDDHTKLSYSTSGEILASLVSSHTQLVGVINKIVKLAIGHGLVELTREEYQIILTYYQFQLIYSKFLLGVVISSKISL
ncbi:MAG: hypothetical protein WCG06_05210 [Candidatus Omnitrophota bacterium]